MNGHHRVALLDSVPTHIRAAMSDEKFRVFTNVTDHVEIRLDGVVGDEYTQSDAASIGRLLRQNASKPVKLVVNSGGGLAYDGLQIFNAIEQHPSPTAGVVESLAASAAAVAVLGCQTVSMKANATFMIHQCVGFAYGHAHEIRQLLEFMDRLDAAICDSISAKTGIAREIVQQHLEGSGDGTVMTAEEAKSHGYVHEVIAVGKRQPEKARNEQEQARFRAAAMRNRMSRARC